MTIWLHLTSPQNSGRGPLDLDREPCDTIMAKGIGSAFVSQHHLTDDGRPP